MLVSLLTPTGARPEAFALCEQWIKSQTYKGKIEWICTDDYAKAPTKFTQGQLVLPVGMQWTPEINTQRFNMHTLIEACKGDYIFIIEDDEYYAPDYIESMLKLLETSEIAGISNDRYYHLRAKGYKLIGNWKHASLCRTVLRSSIKRLLYQAVHSGQYYFDIDLWTRVRDKQIPMNLIAHSDLSVGIKGMPGRLGLGAGHEVVGYVNDKTLDKFKEWLGADWVHYQRFLK